MKIFSTKQIGAWDKYTIKNEPIPSVKLMERAAEVFVSWFRKQFPDKKKAIYVYCGNGNNGGDGLAIARLLHQRSFNVSVVVMSASEKRTKDNQANLDVAKSLEHLELNKLTVKKKLPVIEEGSIVIDALFGTGLTRELDGFYKKVVSHLNSADAIRVAVDVPSGLLGDSPSKGTLFQANFTCTFEQPKLAFFFPENQKYIGEWKVKSIRLAKAFASNEPTKNHLLTKRLVRSYIKSREKFTHKGTFGHALLILGSYGKMGAAVLSASACARSGCGLTSIYIPSCGVAILQTSVPEAMVIADDHEKIIASMPVTSHYQAIGVGCGIGTEMETQEVVYNLVRQSKKPLVIDADALNLLALNQELLSEIPKNSILTPHPKEFERLFGKSKNDFERNKLQRQKAIQLKCFIVLKGANTCIATPQGECFFNSTGNPGMATGGSGDVLTGLLTGLLAQGYNSGEAACLGVFLHGLAGDIAAKQLSEEALIASDLINFLPEAFLKLKGE